MNIQLLGTKGSGSLIVEAALIIAHVPYTFVETNYEIPSDLERLQKINPTGQIPAMVLADGEILTESAAMINYIHLLSPETKLIPMEMSQNVRYWDWILFINAWNRLQILARSVPGSLDSAYGLSKANLS